MQVGADQRTKPCSLRNAKIPDAARALFIDAGYPVLRYFLVDAMPAPGYDIDGWHLRDARPTATEGDVIDLGDWRAEVLHRPGHSPGQVGLRHGESGTLSGADAIYDGPLIYADAGMSVSDYADTLRRIRALPVRVGCMADTTRPSGPSGCARSATVTLRSGPDRAGSPAARRRSPSGAK